MEVEVIETDVIIDGETLLGKRVEEKIPSGFCNCKKIAPRYQLIWAENSEYKALVSECPKCWTNYIQIWRFDRLIYSSEIKVKPFTLKA